MLTNKFKGLSRNTFLLAFSSFFADISTEMLFPVLPIFLTEVLQAPASIVGLVEGIAQASQNIVQGLSGSLADKIGSSKKVALFGYTTAAIAKPFMGLSTTWQQLLVGRSVDRLGSGARSAPRDALIASSAKSGYRGRAFGVEGIGDNMGAVVGPAIAALLFYSLRLKLRTMFYAAFIPGLLSIIFVAMVKEGKRVAKASNQSKSGFVDLPHAYWKYLAASAVFGLGNISSAFLILRAKDVGIATGTTILVYALFNFSAALASYPAGSLSDKIGRRNILIASLAIAAVSFLGFAISSSLAAIGALFILYGVYQGVLRVVGKAMAIDFVSPQLRATGVGLYSTVVGLTSLAASLTAGLIWDRINPSATFMLASLFMVAGGISMLLVTNKLQKD